jgi:hypothetical protein
MTKVRILMYLYDHNLYSLHKYKILFYEFIDLFLNINILNEHLKFQNDQDFRDKDVIQWL